ncbi:MAG: HAD-IA family hydrolase [Burkholderiaceae bacterium]
MSSFDLIIFDCDGVLVDSEVITNQVFCEMLNEIGMTIELERMFELFVGLSEPQCVEIITRMHGAPPPGFVDEYHRRAGMALDAGVLAVNGIERVLDGLTLPCCVASSATHAKIRLTLGRTGLLPRFEGRIFSVADVTRPKPAPDIYLLAARTYGVPAGRCVVVEDSPAGVAAGVAAGMRVFGYCERSPASRLRAAGAHRVFERMADLPALLAAEET